MDPSKQPKPSAGKPSLKFKSRVSAPPLKPEVKVKPGTLPYASVLKQSISGSLGYCQFQALLFGLRAFLNQTNFLYIPDPLVSYLSVSFSLTHPTFLLYISLHQPPDSIMDDLTWYDREFPSLSNNSQLGNAGQTSTWSTAGRNFITPIPRNQPTPTSSQAAQQHDDIFNGSSRLPSAQSSFRFGNQGGLSQSSQSQATSADEFPPLRGNANGDIGQERSANMASGFRFSSTSAASTSATQPHQGGNGLLSAVSANARVAEVRSPTTGEPFPSASADTNHGWPVTDGNFRHPISRCAELCR